MIGTIVNTAAILSGGLLGHAFGRFFSDRIQSTLTVACGVGTMFIGASGALGRMLDAAKYPSGGSMLVVLCLALGGLLGEALNIEGWFERLGAYLKVKTGNARDARFVDAFVTASLTVCIGAMAIVGAIEDGLTGNWSVLGAKAVLDLIIIMVMTCSMGKGCAFSAVPVFLWEGALTLLSGLIRPIMTDMALDHLSLVGNVLIFCVGLNLVFGKKVRVANLLPAVLFAVAAAFLPERIAAML